MSKRFFAFGVLVVLLAGGSALADHHDPHGDASTTNPRCDSWYRDGYDKTAPYGDTHHEPGTSTPTERNLGGPDNTAIIAEGGHYVVNSNSFYVEVVGGQEYARPTGGGESRGGYVQGEVDHAMVPVDVDFLAATFAGAGSNNNDPDYVEKDACVNANNTRLAQMDCTKPPKETTTNCN